MRKYRVILVDDHALIRYGLKKMIEEDECMEVVGEAGDGIQALALLKKLKPDMVILDVSMPNLGGIEAISEIKKINTKAKILMVTFHKDKKYLQGALYAGAHGYVLKEDGVEELHAAIEKIRANKIYVTSSLTKDLLDSWGNESGGPHKRMLTNRGREILKLVAEGKTSAEIADLLEISVHTVLRHRAIIKKRLNLKKTADLVKYAIQEGYVTDEHLYP